MRTQRLLGSVCGVALLPLTAYAADWPQWRGPQRNGVSAETALLKEWPKAGPRLVWQATNIGDGYAAPSIVGNRIYILGNRGLDNEFVQALSTRDGKRIWSTTTRESRKSEPDAFVSHGPLHADHRWRAAVCAGLRWRPGVRENLQRQDSVEEEPADRFRRRSRQVGLCGIAADRWRCGDCDARRRTSYGHSA